MDIETDLRLLLKYLYTINSVVISSQKYEISDIFMYIPLDCVNIYLKIDPDRPVDRFLIPLKRFNRENILSIYPNITDDYLFDLETLTIYNPIIGDWTIDYPYSLVNFFIKKGLDIYNLYEKFPKYIKLEENGN